MVRPEHSGGAGPAWVEAEATLDGQAVGRVAGWVSSGEGLVLPLDVVAPWSPEDAVRYDLTLTEGRQAPRDVVHSYFGLDEVGRDWLPGRGPDDGAPIDELGFLLVYDIPSLDIEAKAPDGSPARALFEETLRQVVARDRNHPSLALWVVFNENWGLIPNGSLLDPTRLADDPDMQRWVREMVDLTRTLDPTRPVEDDSAGGVVGDFEHVGSDSNSFHYYASEAAQGRAFLDEQAALTFPGSPHATVGGGTQDGAPWWNSEFASFSTFGGEDGPGIYCDLFGALDELRRQPKLTGYVLTQLTDVEFERNGLAAYDRSERADLCTRSGVGLQDVLGDDFIGFEWLPGEQVDPSAQVAVPLWFSQWSAPTPRALTVRLSWDDGEFAAEQPLTGTPDDVSALNPLALTVPGTSGTHTLVAEVVDAGGGRVCANRIEVEVR